MPNTSLLLCVFVSGFALSQLGAQPQTPPGVWTAQYNNDRSGSNLRESILTTSNVNSKHFGLLFTLPVDEYVYAQPLFIPALIVNGSQHNVLFVATLKNSVYAFDADSKNAPLWHVNLGPAATLSGPRLGSQCGILSTPVIDTIGATLYVVALTYESGARIFRLHALDITTGTEKLGGPVMIQASVPGSAPDAKDGMVAFNAAVQFQRPSLLLNNGTVGVLFGTVDEANLYHGWAMFYNASTLLQESAFATTPNGDKGGIWMSGRGAAADSNGAYFMVGNGSSGNGNYGEGAVRVSQTAMDFFIPDNTKLLTSNDWDFGAGGPLLIPNTNLLVGGGKTGEVFVLDRTNLGGYVPGNTQVVQSWQATAGCPGLASSCHEIHQTAYWFRTGGNSPLLYVWAWQEPLNAYAFNGSTFNTTPVATYPTVANFPGGAMAISANGSTSGTGILWATMTAKNAGGGAVPGTLRAFNAETLVELWDSNMNPGDSLGLLPKFCEPTVANGKVYMATFSKVVNVYGLH